MGWRMRKSFKITKGVRLNLSKSGLGLSVGVKGLKFGVGPRGAYTSVGIPGTGLYNISYLGKKSKQPRGQPQPALNLPVGSNLPIPQELTPGVAVGCLWTVISVILLASYPVAGVISVAGQVAFYIRNMKTAKSQARKLFIQGKAAYDKGDYVTSLDNFSKVLELQPQIKSLLPLVADLNFGQGKYQEAISLYQKHLADNAGDMEIQSKLALTLFEDKKYDEAITILQNLPSEIKEELSIINLTAACFVQMGKFDLALAFLEKGPVRKRKMDDEMMEFRYLLGVCYQKQGENKKAVNQLQKIYAEDVTFADVEERLRQLEAM